jgi:hypothetical protein
MSCLAPPSFAVAKPEMEKKAVRGREAREPEQMRCTFISTKRALSIFQEHYTVKLVQNL